MKLTAPAATSAVVAVVALAGIVALSLFHVTVPDVLAYVALGALGAGAGLSLPAGSSTAASSSTAPAEAPPVLPPVPPVPAPADPPTGVILGLSGLRGKTTP